MDVRPSFETPRKCAAPQNEGPSSQSLQNRRLLQLKVLQQIDECRQPSLAIGIDIEPFVIEKAFAGLEADLALGHVAADDLRRGVGVVVQGAGEILAGVIKNIAAAPIDEFQEAQPCEAESEAVFDRLVD